MPRIFEHRSVINTTIEQMVAFHQHPKAFQRLTPPPVFIQVQRNALNGLTDGEVEFTMWMGPVPVRWLARHEPGPTETSFIDRQMKGPLKSWEHQHIFKPVEGGVELLDHITLEHQSGWKGLLTRLTFDGFPLRMLFIYRHWRTRIGTRK